MFFVVVRVEIAISICMCRFPIDVNIEFPRSARDEGIKESQLVIGFMCEGEENMRVDRIQCIVEGGDF